MIRMGSFFYHITESIMITRIKHLHNEYCRINKYNMLYVITERFGFSSFEHQMNDANK